jgi:two-component system, chemotaxis family, sensor kinase Cph1
MRVTSTMQPTVDLTNCDREPIHIPGAIQPHGVLLALREPGFFIEEASNNTLALLGQGHADLLGRSLDTLLTETSSRAIAACLAAPDPRASSPVRVETVEACGSRRFDAILHRSGRLVVLELEPAQTEEVAFNDFYRRVRGAVGRLHRATRVVELCQHAADEIAELTGFDRVMAYRFDRDDHGHVIAETKRASLESFLDLHYPASDIPVQARRLYTINWLRLIADVGYRPAEIVSSGAAPLDLSFSVLRSVSPIHLEYLRNMRVCASMSISLVVDGRLWGMLICHHYSPRFVRYDVRAACEFFGQTLSWQIAARERAELFEARANTQRTVTQVLKQLGSAPRIEQALRTDPSSLLALTAADGAAVQSGGEWTLFGTTPPREAMSPLADCLRDRLSGGVFASDHLRSLWPAGPWTDSEASGALALSLAPTHDPLLVFLRQEVVQTVNWAGDPNKLASLADGDHRLTPRGSFALWRETVRGRSLPWQSWQVDAALDLRQAVVGHALQQSQELASLNARLSVAMTALARAKEDLEAKVIERTAALENAHRELTVYADELAKSNVELERFAYVASHDLQEPLRMVVSYVQLLERRYRGKLDGDADEFIAFAVDGAKRMQGLINDLLAYARIGRSGRASATVDLEQVLSATQANLSLAIEECGARVTHDTLPEVLGDASQLGQLLQNLLGNALKFRAASDPTIQVSVTDIGLEWQFTVRDNGIGIASEHRARVFAIFQRLHTRGEYAGTGVGLAICKKIVEQHGGRIWVESEVGHGSTFYFTLPKRGHEATA